MYRTSSNQSFQNRFIDPLQVKDRVQGFCSQKIFNRSPMYGKLPTDLL